MSIGGLLAAILVLAGVRWMRTWLFERAPMPETAYRRSVIAFQAARDWRLVTLALVPALPLLVAPRLVGWEALGPLEPLRWVGAAVAAVLAWTYATYEHNRFLRRTHLLDRLLVVALAGLVLLHPAASAALAVQIGVMARQFEHPRCLAYSMTPIRLPLDMLMTLALWPAAMMLCAPPPALLVVLLLAVAGAQYFAAALAKALIGPRPWWWAMNDRPHYLMAAAMGQGWLGNPPRPRLLALAHMLRWTDRPGAIGAFVLDRKSVV